MPLSNDLLAQITKVTTSNKKVKTDTTVYGKVVVHNGQTFAQFDGSNLLTPITTTADVKDGERVTITVKNHSATVTGNVSSPAARVEDVTNVANTVTKFDTILAYKVTTDDLDAVNATIENLKVKIANIENIEAVNAIIENLQVTYADMKYITTDNLKALNAEIDKLQATVGEFTDISTEDLEAINADIENLRAHNGNFTYVTADVMEALKASIMELNAEKLSAESANLTYVNIDFSNIDKAWMDEFYAKSGLIEHVTMADGTVTGNLVGVTIKGDLIEGNTIVADKLVIRGQDGLYYKLNTSIYDTVCYKVTYDSETGIYTATTELIETIEGIPIADAYTDTNQSVYAGVTENGDEIYFYKELVYNNEKVDLEEVPRDSLNGSVITAKSVTAEKISVKDLVAFDATIGGFKISDKSIYSGVKESLDNTTRGIYLDSEGQVNIGDETNFLRYYKTSDGNYKLEISAESVLFGVNSKTSMKDIKALTEHIKISSYKDPDTGNVEPSIELAEGDSDFKQILTSTKAMFLKGSIVRTKIDATGGLTSENATIEKNLNIGGFAWTKRSNGNCGLVWKGVSS